jgi:ferredoxin
MFAWANGPQAIKPYLFSPREELWSVTQGENGRLAFSATVGEQAALAVIGVRSCDLAALRLQDRHFIEGETVDPHYAERRSNLLLIAVNCTHPAQTCFCASTGDGPTADSGYDLLLDELDDGFILRAGSESGERLMPELPLVPVHDDQYAEAGAAGEAAAGCQLRAIPQGDLFDALLARREHPRWAEVAERCLSCGNCTQVCPSCFCSSEHEQPLLDGSMSAHIRQWDSCFSEGHSYIHGLVIRKEVRHRYRQWLTHKLGSWHRQYGRSGCVGCGRCIAWCPVGIDICEEVNVLLGERGDA